MSAGEKYLWAAYVLFLVAVLAYLAIHALKLQRLQRETAELAERLLSRRDAPDREEARVGG